ncbi:MAG TPA: T9SS type A sorting domain-containing protein, partial [Bacteroidia bacterium]|nr:T9SS type A sorting domain-containing protein [Bacteroidia bacterium]
RALYNVINTSVELFKDNCPNNNSSRLGNNPLNPISNWIVNIYPNPASNELFISTNNEKEDVKVVITDVNGRTVGDYNLKTSGFSANIKLNMNSGIYFVTLVNQNNEKVVKKLVITK